MNAVHSLVEKSVKEHVSPEEWQVRVELAACYRLIAMYGWDDLVFTHISAKIPGTEHFLINPYGLMFEEVTASNLVKIDLQGNKVVESPYDVNPAGFTIHSAIHEIRHDANCVLHTHTAAGIAVSTQKEGILPISQQSIFVLSSLAYHDYEGVALNAEEKPRLQADLGRANNLILRNHGLLVCGKSVAEAFLTMYTLQRCCEIQVRAQAQNAELIPIPQAVLDGAAASMKAVTKGAGAGIAWPALLRKIQRVNPGFDV
ncbi:class II aldolase/adducin family protein [Pseudomonas neustonica]|uniref:class II aldolase/adducin family protein n=1 Tax=Pseudomonas TaxID=286 RepID=UPI000C89BDD6|nr:class II aldolase/adducin family protein [Pseudomonas sp. 5Ae-yellow]MAB25373.1 class II aldolase [Pseudomonadales bacterium]MBA6420600.1 class II aldolase/adducin family protein [Pseudomonas sp. 5Ae-yellow]